MIHKYDGTQIRVQIHKYLKFLMAGKGWDEEDKARCWVCSRHFEGSSPSTPLINYFKSHNNLQPGRLVFGFIPASIYLLAIIFLEYNELYLSKHLSSRAAAARWRGGDGCSFPATHQIGHRTISNISGNCWELFINVLRAFWRSLMQCCRWFTPPPWARLDCRHCIYMVYM